MTRYSLVADVGATNARFALVEQGSTQLQQIKTLPCENYPSLQGALADYLLNIDVKIDAACIAIAGAVHQAEFQLANNHWRVSKAAVDQLVQLEVLLINDFTAQAWAMSQVEEEDLLLVKPGQSVAHGNRLVMGPGTGLGVAGLVAHGQGWLPVMGEGGHTSLAPANPQQCELLKYMWQRYDHVSIERFLSGSGLMDLYAAVAHTQGNSPVLTQVTDLVERAQNTPPDPLARQTLEVFCAMLGHAVANAALLYGAVGGVYLTGGILPRIQEFLLASEFNQNFVAKGRLGGYLEEVPIYLCCAAQPGLSGAAIALNESVRS